MKKMEKKMREMDLIHTENGVQREREAWEDGDRAGNWATIWKLCLLNDEAREAFVRRGGRESGGSEPGSMPLRGAGKACGA